MSPITRNTTAANILAAKDTNVPITISNTSTNGAAGKDAVVKGDFKTMEYHRQILQSKIEAQKYEVAAPYHKAVSELTQDRGSASNNYVSPSDEIMSPCTAKLSALRNKQVGKCVTLLDFPSSIT